MSQDPPALRTRLLAPLSTNAALLLAFVASTIHADDAPPLVLERAIALPGVEGRLDHMSLTPDGTRLFLAALGNGSVEVIDLAAEKRTGRIEGLSEPQGVLFLAEGNRLVVSTGGDGNCRIYDADTLVLHTTVALGDDADNIRYDPASRRAFVGFGNGALGILDPTKGTRESVIQLDGHPEAFALETAGKRIFVNVPAAHQVAVVDRERAAVVARWKIPDESANFPMALDEAHHRLFVGCRKPPALAVLDTESGKTVACIPGSGDPDDIFLDAPSRRIYVSCGEGFIDVLTQDDADHYTPLARIATAAGARTALYDAERKRLYLAVPHRGEQRAELRTYSVR